MPKCQQIKKDELDQHATERFDWLIFTTYQKSVGLNGFGQPSIYLLTYLLIKFTSGGLLMSFHSV